MDKAKKVYRLIKIYGLVSFIPVVLFSGPVGGYFLGDFFVKRFGWRSWVIALFVVAGFLASIKEVIKIVKMLIRTDQEIDKDEKADAWRKKQ
ncbi:MAG TPA: AtpZ/AtpI family protein [Candidatus Omnitrophota bacterium]|nr:AtpZ/AtpI family protein [Candidatus Omnitrophota bacterium]HPS20861.1 AtpZ/AtpI family protein [Candidatus Omnitrophota bacterium]